MKDIEKRLKEMLLKGCNNQIHDFNEICNWLSQYSQANVFLIPIKYQETITNELNTLIEQNHIPIIYEFQDAPDPNIVMLTLFNFGVMQRESIINEMKKE